VATAFLSSAPARTGRWAVKPSGAKFWLWIVFGMAMISFTLKLTWRCKQFTPKITEVIAKNGGNPGNL
jgi:hypothetical protein